MSPRVRARARRALLASCVALALAGCGDANDDAEAGAEPLGGEKAGSVASLVQCRDWVEGTSEEKLATIADIRSQLNPEVGTGAAPPLSDEEATELFDNACAEPFAATFKLYVLYARAAGFAPLTRDLPE